MEDQELIKKFLGGNEDSLQLLFQRYLQPIYHFVYSSVRDAGQAEDITQEVFIKVWGHLKSFDQTKNFRVWIYTIAKHTVYDFLRKKKLIPFSFLEREDEVYDVADTDPLPDKILETKQAGEKMEGALGTLSMQYREVLVLYYQEGFNFREIADILKTSVNTVKSRHRRALTLLKRAIQKEPRA
jgi:RNA polymerase sigma-70 factor (ECF subfamily)